MPLPGRNYLGSKRSWESDPEQTCLQIINTLLASCWELVYLDFSGSTAVPDSPSGTEKPKSTERPLSFWPQNT